MIALIQRVSQGAVDVDDQRIAQIDRGIVALIAVQATDGIDQVKRMVQRIVNYRIFPDNVGKMNLSLLNVNGGLILVPQFTLLADTSRGNRPSFSNNVAPEEGKKIFDQLVDHAKQEYSNVQNGTFGADMQVTLVNDGPVTLWLEV